MNTNPKWEVFEGQQYGASARTEPRVTINSKSTFVLNEAAWEALDCADAVELQFDSRQRLIGLKPIDPRKRNAFAIKLVDKRRRGRRIHVAAFCRFHHLDFDKTFLIDPIEFNHEGVMVLNLEKVFEVKRGAR